MEEWAFFVSTAQRIDLVRFRWFDPQRETVDQFQGAWEQAKKGLPIADDVARVIEEHVKKIPLVP